MYIKGRQTRTEFVVGAANRLGAALGATSSTDDGEWAALETNLASEAGKVKVQEAGEGADVTRVLALNRVTFNNSQL